MRRGELHEPQIILLLLHSFGEVEGPAIPSKDLGTVTEQWRDRRIESLSYLERSFHYGLHHLVRSVVNEFPLETP